MFRFRISKYEYSLIQMYSFRLALLLHKDRKLLHIDATKICAGNIGFYYITSI